MLVSLEKRMGRRTLRASGAFVMITFQLERLGLG
jgi:hypothetical protein